MSKYLVTVTESHTYAVEVFASSIEEAEARAERQVSRGDRRTTVSGIYDTELNAVLVEEPRTTTLPLPPISPFAL